MYKFGTKELDRSSCHKGSLEPTQTAAMADDEPYPQEIHTAKLDLENGKSAVHEQLRGVAQYHKLRTREFAARVCRSVGILHCTCDGDPQPLEDYSNRQKRRDAARAHPGTCGVAMADIIASVETEEVEQTAASRNQEATYKTFRNQACYNAARALNVRGAGVQVRRNTCFEKACQALWPGDSTIDGWAAEAFSSNNVSLEAESED